MDDVGEVLLSTVNLPPITINDFVCVYQLTTLYDSDGRSVDVPAINRTSRANITTYDPITGLVGCTVSDKLKEDVLYNICEP